MKINKLIINGHMTAIDRDGSTMGAVGAAAPSDPWSHKKYSIIFNFFLYFASTKKNI